MWSQSLQRKNWNWDEKFENKRLQQMRDREKEENEEQSWVKREQGRVKRDMVGGIKFAGETG